MRPILPAVLAGVLTVASAAEVSFTAKPVVTMDGDKAKIAFTVSSTTDVEVAVLAADGKVVRHLAAGVLGGPKDPPAPLAKGLAQTLEWDGRDDFARLAAGGPFKVRVRAGTGVKFGRLIGEDAYAFGVMDSMAADEDGNLYVMGNDAVQGQQAKVLRVFDAEGRYLRTIMPFPADLPPTAMKGLAAWDESRRTFHPRIQSGTNPEMYGVNLALHIFAASKQNGVYLTDGGSIWRLDAANGAVLGASPAQGMWAAGMRVPITDMRQSDNAPPFLTASPDGKYVYFSGPHSNAKRGNDPKFPPGCIYRMKVGAGETMQLFTTLPVSGAYLRNTQCADHFIRPHGPVHQVAVDAKGNVYVTDRERNRIAIFDESGKEAGEISVKYPHLVAVHPRTGAIYVVQWDCIGYHQYQCVLLKFAQADKAAQPVAKYDFSKTTEWPSLTLVAGKDRTVVWLGGATLEDDGAGFKTVKTAYSGPANPLAMYSRMEVDYARNEVYIQDGLNLMARFDGKTGQGGLLKKNGATFNVVDMTVGYDGLLYMQPGRDHMAPLARFTRELEPAPFPGIGTHVLMPSVYGRMGVGNCQKGAGIGPDGSTFICYMYTWVGYWLKGFGPDGKPLPGAYLKSKDANKNKDANGAILGPIPHENGGVRVDLQGNLYLGVRVLPKGFANPRGYEADGNYKAIVGSVLKFPKGGGAFVGGCDDLKDADAALVAKLPSLEVNHVAKGPMKAAGASNIYPGIAPFSGAGAPQTGHNLCVCRVPRFDLDRYGRLALPNAVTCSVLLYDNAGNLIMEFGKYGNFDSQYVNPNLKEGKEGKPTVGVPEIPLAWPTCAGFSENHIYVLDTYNRRAVRADLTYKAEELCDVK